MQEACSDILSGSSATYSGILMSCCLGEEDTVVKKLGWWWIEKTNASIFAIDNIENYAGGEGRIDAQCGSYMGRYVDSY